MIRTKKVQLKSSDIEKIRNKLCAEQNNICPICQNIINRPVLDHHHIKRIKGTGLVRGVLCNSCNVFLAKIENNCVRYAIGSDRLPEVLRAIAEYLEKEHTCLIHPSEKPKEPKLKKSSYNQLHKEWRKDWRYSKKRFPEYPKSGKLTKQLAFFFSLYQVQPEFYK